MTEEVEKQVLELATRYHNLRIEIMQNQRILEQYHNDLKKILKQNNMDIAQNDELTAKLKITKRTVFDSTAFKREHNIEWDKCRKNTKRFDNKLVQKNYPKLFEEYQKETVSESLVVERNLDALQKLEEL